MSATKPTPQFVDVDHDDAVPGPLRPERTMSRTAIRRAASALVVIVMALSVGVSTASAGGGRATTTPVSGSGVFDTTGACPQPPAEYADYPAIVLTGGLQGCWYTHIDRAWDLGVPSGLYFEVGRELFVGRLAGHAAGGFTTRYAFQSKWDPDVTTGHEVWGTCEHPIAAGSGTGGFAGASGYFQFVDIVSDGSYRYSGWVRV
jgi:hypothetical protein